MYCVSSLLTQGILNLCRSKYNPSTNKLKTWILQKSELLFCECSSYSCANHKGKPNLIRLCTISHDGYSLQGSSIDHPIKSDHIGNWDLAFMINDIPCNKVPISVSKCEKRWKYLGLFSKDCWNIVILEFYIHLCPDSNCCFEINVNLWILWINSRLKEVALWPLFMGDK